MKQQLIRFVLRFLCKLFRFETNLNYRIAYKHLDRALMFLNIEDKRKDKTNV